MKRLSALFLAASLFATPAIAQQGAPVTRIAGYKTLAVTSTTDRVQLAVAPSASVNAIAIYNYGAADAFYCKGDSTVVAVAATCTIVKAGTIVGDYVATTHTYLAAITETGSTDLLIYQGAGAISFLPPPGSGGGGGGGAVTIANGADSTQGAVADAASTAGGTGTLSAKLRLMTTQLGTINTTLGTPFQAGGSIGNTTFGSTPAAGAVVYSHQAIAISSAGDNTVITRVTGTIKVYALELSCASAVPVIDPKNGASTSLGAKSNTNSLYEWLNGAPIYVTTTTNNFVINLSDAISCTGWAKYIDN